jgi:pyruvate dehydrogenase E2 component (dihydrolipoamide acetyltransferase)
MLALRRLALPARRLTRGLALPPHTVVGLPALSPTMTQGNIAKYVANVGDELAVGDRLAEIETDKATVDFEMADDGVLAKILLPEGASDIPVGTPMVVLVDDVAHVAAFADFTVDAAPAAEAAPAAPAPAPAAAPAAPAAAPAPAAAATPAPASVAGVSMPATSGRVYWNPEKGWFRA